MTEENFKYRTNPLFLRNEFDSKEEWAMPVIPKPQSDITINGDLRLIGFDRAKTGKDNHYNRAVHFFLYDYKFEDIWEKPQKYIETLKKYKAVLTPDFSMYIEMNPVMQLYNTFRNRWVGAYLASKGITVIPTVNWGLENTFDFCFNGIEKGSIVAVSTYMYHEHGNHSDQKELFMKGYNEMLRRIEPELVICYSEPFPEMQGNILYIDYDLSSWQHYADDECKSFNTSTRIFKYHCGYVLNTAEEKGSGSAFGGKWKPKKEEDERFIGTPGEIKVSYTRHGEKKLTKIGDDGYAIRERHFSVHSHPNAHTNPHDHVIDWSKNYPNPGKPINYYDEVPEFKNYGDVFMSNKDIFIDDSDRFESISDFKYALICGREVEFEWNGIKYGAFHEGEGDKEFFLCEAYKDDVGTFFKSADNLLDFEIQGVPLRKIITDVIVWNRNL